MDITKTQCILQGIIPVAIIFMVSDNTIIHVPLKFPLRGEDKVCGILDTQIEMGNELVKFEEGVEGLQAQLSCCICYMQDVLLIPIRFLVQGVVPSGIQRNPSYEWKIWGGRGQPS
jgi:hypothetical protein